MIRKIYMLFAGYITIKVEGFFIERFINICMSKKIILLDSHREKSTILKAKILKSEFKKIRNIAKKTKCKIKIEEKRGLPFLLNRYKKRKIFAITAIVIAIFILCLSNFVWNIDVQGNQIISTEEIIQSLNEKGLKIGVFKYSVDKEKMINQIRIENEKIAWIGIDIKGTNAIIKVVEATDKPEIVNKDEFCNIVADKAGIVSKIIVQNGTAKVNIGDNINVGDLLVEGVMHGKHTGDRFVHAEADIYIKNYYEKEKREEFVQTYEEETGNKEFIAEIYINNFKINFNKGVSKFKNYDTIRASEKIKLFSNFYIPVEIIKTTNFEKINVTKKYEQNELVEKITRRIRK